MNHMPSISRSEKPEYLEALLDRMEIGLREGLVPCEVFGDPAVFKAEMEQIYSRNWIFVGFESEIPNPGDYVLRRIGTESVIVTRDAAGAIHVLSNYCRHRGTLLCQADKGNSTHFRCAYHGWTYKNNGDFAGAPHMRDAYRKLDRADWGLLRAAHVDTYLGLIFATLDESASSLKDYLGSATWMLDALIGLHPEGMTVLGPPDRYRLRADWKNGAENFGGDIYHVDVAHISLDEIGYGADFNSLNSFSSQYVMDNGHTFLGHGYCGMFGPQASFWAYPPEQKNKFDLSRLDDVQREMIEKDAPVVGTIFPNLSFLRFNGAPEPGKPPVVYTSWRQWQPIAPGVMELWSWQLAWNFMSEEEKRASYAAGQFGFSSAGVFEQDDTVVWEGARKAAQSFWARKSHMMFNYQLGMDGMGAQQRVEDWKGPGMAFRPGPGEATHRAFFQHWLQQMRRTA